MQVLQRSLMVIVSACFLVFLLVISSNEQQELGTGKWREIQTERFMYRLSKDGCCVYEEYLAYLNTLNKSGEPVRVLIREYQKEKDMSGKTYWYLVSWEEIQNVLVIEGKYSFQNGSAIEIVIFTEQGKQERTYYDVVRRKDW